MGPKSPRELAAMADSHLKECGNQELRSRNHGEKKTKNYGESPKPSISYTSNAFYLSCRFGTAHIEVAKIQ